MESYLSTCNASIYNSSPQQGFLKFSSWWRIILGSFFCSWFFQGRRAEKEWINPLYPSIICSLSCPLFRLKSLSLLDCTHKICSITAIIFSISLNLFQSNIFLLKWETPFCKVLVYLGFTWHNSALCYNSFSSFLDNAQLQFASLTCVNWWFHWYNISVEL